MLNDREESVLKTIIEEYIRTSEPVGSRYVSKSGPLALSAASIRNVMSDLEDKGFIMQPHTSSGRIPSDTGYRYYIDKIVKFSGTSIEEIEKLSEQFNLSPSSVKGLFRDMSKQMGSITGSVGFVLSPKLNTMYLKHIEFLRLNSGTALAIIVTRNGMVHNVMLSIDPSTTDSELTRISNYLNEHFKNKSLMDVRGLILGEMKDKLNTVDEIVQKVQNIGRTIFERASFGDEIIVEGTSNILKVPEFRDTEKLQSLLDIFEEKKFICDILDRCMEQKGIQIFVGSEIGKEEINEMGLVTKSYSRGGEVVGTLGIIGPKRMQYSQVASIVDFSSQILSNMLSSLEDKDDE